MLAVLVLLACGSPEAPAPPPAPPAPPPPPPVTLHLAVDVPDAWRADVVSAFQADWKASRGQEVVIEDAPLGADADVVVATEPAILALETAGHVGADWRAGPNGGFVSRSYVVVAVRPGNPKGIRDWHDVVQPGLHVLAPDVRQSLHARWFPLAVHGAALRGKVKDVPGADPLAADAFLADVLRNTPALDATPDVTLSRFAAGEGDVAIAVESDLLAARGSDHADYVLPSSTFVVETAAVVLDGPAKARGSLEVAEGFVTFLAGSEAQMAFVRHGHRPLDASKAGHMPAATDAFTVKDLGGWPALETSLFLEGAGYDRAMGQARPRP